MGPVCTSPSVISRITVSTKYLMYVINVWTPDVLLASSSVLNKYLVAVGVNFSRRSEDPPPLNPKHALSFDRQPVSDSWRTRTTKLQLVLRRWFIAAICCWRRSKVRWQTLPSRSSAPATARRASRRRGTRDYGRLLLVPFCFYPVGQNAPVKERQDSIVKRPFVTSFFRRVWVRLLMHNLWNIFLTVCTSVCEPPLYILFYLYSIYMPCLFLYLYFES